MHNVSPTLLTAVLFLAVAPLVAQQAWLPEELKTAMSEQLAVDLRTADPEGLVVPGDGRSTARAGVAGTAARIEAVGADGLVELAPDFPGLPLPEAEEAFVEAIVHWGICSLPTMAAFSDTSQEPGSVQRRVSGAAMTVTVTLVNMYLRHEYKGSGSTDGLVASYYSRDDVGATLRELRGSGELLLEVMDECSGPLSQLMQ